MKLEYNILWIDDQPDNIAEFWEAIRGHLQNEGILACKTPVKTEDQLQQLLKRRDLDHKFDIVLMDQNLGHQDGPDGADLAKKIRQKLRYTDMIYYSSASQKELRSRIAEVGLDGVYCCSRLRLAETTTAIIDVHIHRYTQDSNLRGLVVSKLSDFDHQVKSALLTCNNLVTNEAGETMRQRLIEAIIEKSEGVKKDVEKISEKTFKDILFSRGADTGISYNILLKIIDGATIQSCSSCSSILKDYMVDIIEMRNVLAHGEYNSKEKKFTLGRREIQLNDATCRKIRNDLLRHEANLKSIERLINVSNPDIELVDSLTSSIIDA